MNDIYSLWPHDGPQWTAINSGQWLLNLVRYRAECVSDWRSDGRNDIDEYILTAAYSLSIISPFNYPAATISGGQQRPHSTQTEILYQSFQFRSANLNWEGRSTRAPLPKQSAV